MGYHMYSLVFCNFHRLEMPEQALGGILLGLGIVVEDTFYAV